MKTQKVIAITAIKGGTGKTATAGALAFSASHDQRKALVIDADPQGNVTLWLNGDKRKGNLYKLLENYITPEESIQHTPYKNIDIIAGASDLSQLTSKANSGTRLRTALQDPAMQSYDIIIIDTPPSYGELIDNVLTACTDVIIPVQTDADSIQAIYNTKDIINSMPKDARPREDHTGILITMYDHRPTINRLMYDNVKQIAYNEHLYVTGVVRKGIAIRECRALKMDLIDYAPKANVTKDYIKVYNDLMTY